jgi:type VI secretion system secreted protein Hcp
MTRSRKFIIALAALLSALLSVTPVAHADAIYLFATGAKTGVLKGEVTQKGREGSSEVTHLQHEIISPRDPASGMATGRRQHKPLVLSHPFGVMAVQLMNAAATNEVLRDVTIKVWGQDVQGRDTLHTTIRLTNASVASVSMSTVGQARAVQMMQDVALTYQKIEVTDNVGNVVMTDDFNSQP